MLNNTDEVKTSLPLPSDAEFDNVLGKVPKTGILRAYLKQLYSTNGNVVPVLGYLQSGGHYGTKKLDQAAAIFHTETLIAEDEEAPKVAKDMPTALYWNHMVPVLKSMLYTFEGGEITGLCDRAIVKKVAAEPSKDTFM